MLKQPGRQTLMLFPPLPGSRQRAHGQSLVELALVLPILLLLIVGSIDAIQIAMARYTVGQAVRAAVHEAALLGNDDIRVRSIAKTLLDGGLGTHSSKSSMTVTCPSAKGCDRYQPIRVTIQYNDRVWVPIGPFNQFNFTLSATRASEQAAGQKGIGGACGIPGAPACPSATGGR